MTDLLLGILIGASAVSIPCYRAVAGARSETEDARLRADAADPALDGRDLAVRLAQHARNHDPLDPARLP